MVNLDIGIRENQNLLVFQQANCGRINPKQLLECDSTTFRTNERFS